LTDTTTIDKAKARETFLDFNSVISEYRNKDLDRIPHVIDAEPRLFLDNLINMKNNRIIEKDKLKDNTKGGWHISDLVNFGEEF
jgi:hypothetical protein